MEKLNKKIRFSGLLFVRTGLHIGDSKENVQIGGIDSPIVRRRDNNQPYIPGSSIKGKMRCLLEQVRGASKVGDNDQINRLFGMIGNNQQPSRLIVRDAYLTAESEKELSESEFTDYPYTEVKYENTIHRIEGKAINPRQFERVPAGTKFTIEFIVNVWDSDDENELIDLIKEGIKLLHLDYLGGSGSRGYGQVEFSLNFDNHQIVYPFTP